MTDLTTITNTPVPAPARLPALGAPELSVDYLAKMKEIIEVLLGRRGASDWDRAVTFRDLHAAPTIFSPGASTTGDIDAALRNSAVYRDLVHRISDTEQASGYLDEIRSQLDQALADLARDREADIRTVENKIQTEKLSMASRLSEITASLDSVAAGVREFDAASADTVRAVAIRVEQLSASMEGVGTAELEEQLQVVADKVDGLRSQYSLKLQTNPVNGQPPVIAGIDISATSPIAGPGTSEMIFLANVIQFLTDAGAVAPFSISGNRVTMTNVTMMSAIINGVLSAVSGTFGNVSIAADGSLQVGSRTWGGGSGVWFGFDGGLAKFAVGVAGGAELKYDGSQLLVLNPTLSLPSFGVTVDTSPTGGFFFTAASGSNGAFISAFEAAVAGGATGGETYSWSLSYGSGTVRAWLDTTSNYRVNLRTYGNGYIGEVNIGLRCTISRGGLSYAGGIEIVVDFT